MSVSNVYSETAETEVNGCTGCPSTNIFPSPYTISMPLSPTPSKLSRHSCWIARLSLSMCLRPYFRNPTAVKFLTVYPVKW